VGPEFGEEGEEFGNGGEYEDFRDVLPDTISRFGPQNGFDGEGNGFDGVGNGFDENRFGTPSRPSGAPLGGPDYTSGRDDVVIDQPDPYDWLNPPPDEPVGSDGPPDGLDWSGAGEGNGFDEGENGEPYGHVEPTQGTVYTGPQTEPPPVPTEPSPVPTEERDDVVIDDTEPPPPPPPPPPMGSPFAGGFDPNAMPTTAAQFIQAGNPAAASMLDRINRAPVIEDYTTQRAEGGVIEESVGAGDIPKEVLDVVSNAVMNGDEETVMAFKEAVVPGMFSPKEFEEFMDDIESDIMFRQQGPPVGPPMQVGGLIPGNGDAMADNIITMADEGTSDAQKIAVSSGEYVVAGDVVSGLGSGNTDAGAEVLDQLQDDVRIDRTGTPQQPPPMDLSEVLPATYGDRYAQ